MGRASLCGPIAGILRVPLPLADTEAVLEGEEDESAVESAADVGASPEGSRRSYESRWRNARIRFRCVDTTRSAKASKITEVTPDARRGRLLAELVVRRPKGLQ